MTLEELPAVLAGLVQRVELLQQFHNAHELQLAGLDENLHALRNELNQLVLEQKRRELKAPKADRFIPPLEPDPFDDPAR